MTVADLAPNGLLFHAANSAKNRYALLSLSFQVLVLKEEIDSEFMRLFQWMSKRTSYQGPFYFDITH